MRAGWSWPTGYVVTHELAQSHLQNFEQFGKRKAAGSQIATGIFPVVNNHVPLKCTARDVACSQGRRGTVRWIAASGEG
jgi:hypothetical protein